MSLVCLLLGKPTTAFAFTADYHVGAEAQIHRETVTPQFFPILNAGIDADSNRDPSPSAANATTEYKVQADFRISPTHPKAFAITGPNLYYGDKDDDTTTTLRFAFGRKLVGWSRLDDLWELGEFEPLDAWDRLRPHPNGLTGIFAYTETKVVNFRFFASFLSIPEVTPNIVIENNRFVLDHPQSISTAPQSYTLLNRPTPLGYELLVPRIDKILFRPSVAFSIELARELPFDLKFSYGYLPLNYFPVALEASLAIPLDQIIVDLHPRLLHHHLYNTELSHRFSRELSAGVVNLIDHPVDEDPVPADYTTTPLSVSTTWSPWVQYEIPHLRLVLAHLWTTGGLEPDVGPYADPNQSIFSSHILYRNATQLRGRYYLAPSRSGAPYIDARYLHEYAVHGDWLAADFVFYVKPQLTVLVGGDLINAERTVAPDRGAEFLADMRAIDRIRLGVQYVF